MYTKSRKPTVSECISIGKPTKAYSYLSINTYKTKRHNNNKLHVAL